MEASRGGEVIALGVVLGPRELRLQANNERERRRLADAIASFVGDAPLGAHKITRFDLPLPAASPVSYDPGCRPVPDTLVLSMLADTTTLEMSARRLAGQMAACLQASLLVRFAPPAIADAFCATRLGGDYNGTLGTLPVGTDVASIVERTTPTI